MKKVNLVLIIILLVLSTSIVIANEDVIPEVFQGTFFATEIQYVNSEEEIFKTDIINEWLFLITDHSIIFLKQWNGLFKVGATLEALPVQDKNCLRFKTMNNNIKSFSICHIETVLSKNIFYILSTDENNNVVKIIASK